MKTSDFYYDLPHELIAQTPIKDRSAARMLYYDMKNKQMHDEIFTDILTHLRPGDILVRNTTRVIPARLYAHREDTGGLMEFLLLKGWMTTVTRRWYARASAQSPALYIR